MKNNVKSKRNKKAKKYKSIKKVILTVMTVCIVVAGTIGGYAVWSIYQSTSSFDKNRVLSAEPSTITDSQNNVIYTYGDDETGTRENVKYEDIPQVLIDAVIAAEDSRFFEHNGFDVPRIIKAFLGNIAAGGITSGGSTITQQLIKKSYYPDEQQTIERKIGEVFLSMKASKELTKEEVMESYLNKIYFGNSTQSIGVQSASKYYFDKSVSELTLPEAALLAGTLNSPSSYDPYYHMDLAEQRRNTVLSLMVRHGYITQNEADAAKKISISSMLKKGEFDSGYKEENKDYITLVNNEVYRLTGLDPTETEMVIHTFIDTEMQEYCSKISDGNIVSFPDSKMQIGASIQESKTGRITATIGGRNTELFGTNRAENKQQPGSSLKPILDYGAAFEYLGWDTDHLVKDMPYSKNGWNPQNYDKSSHGMITIKNALKNSWNLAAIWTLDEVVQETGWDTIFEMMENFGISMDNEPENMTLAIGGWAYGTSPIELANTYSTVANNGINIQPHTIDYIEIVKTGEIIDIDEMCQTQATRAVSQETAVKIRDVMLSYAGEGNYQQIGTLEKTASKTGTTNDSLDIWMTSFNPDYSISVWSGYDKHASTMEGKSRYGHNVLYQLSKYALEHNGGLKQDWDS